MKILKSNLKNSINEVYHILKLITKIISRKEI